MINARYLKKLTINDEELTDIVIIPSWLLRSLLRYDDELLKQSYNSLTDYGKGVIDTIKKQHEMLSINTDHKL